MSTIHCQAGRIAAAASILALAIASPALADTDAKAKADKTQPALSLKTTRTIAFSTDEGTWISLDVSPDGKTIVFDLLGELYTLPIEGGAAKPVLTGLPFNGQPRFSPDGKRIVFTSDRDGAVNVWTAKVDGSDLRKITSETKTDLVTPAYTPDGRFVMVTRASDTFGGRELWLYDINGGSGIALTKASPAPKTPMPFQLSIAGPTASNDGKYFYYTRRMGVFGYDATFPIWQVVRHDRQTGEDVVMTDEQGSAIRPIVSPDGQTLVYGTRIDAKTGLRVRNLRNGDEHWLKFPIDRDEQEGLGVRDVLPGYAFMPDGKSVVLSYGGHIHRVGIDGGSDQVIPFTVQVSKALGPLLNFPERVEQGAVVSRLAQAPTPSPDGKMIAYSALAHIHVAGAGGAPRRLTSDETPAFQPAWSPDGQWVAYVTWDSTGGAVWKAPVDGSSAPRRLTTAPAFYSTPVFAPDGRSIIAMRSSVSARNHRIVEAAYDPANPGAPETDIVSVPADAATEADSGLRVIAPGRDRLDPQFAQDPGRIYFTSGRGLVSMRLDGSDERTEVKVLGLATTGGAEAEPAVALRVSPDGRSVLALTNHQAYLLPVPGFGGAAPDVDVSRPSLAVQRLSINGADSLGWYPGGHEVFWSLGASFYHRPVAQLTPAEGGKPVRPTVNGEAINLAVSAPRAIPHGDLLLRGGRVITVHGNEVVENADVLIHDNRIAAIGPRGSVTVPAGAEIFDVTGKTIMPGIIDIHAHWKEVRRKVLDLQSWPFLANLAYGVTAGRDPQTFTYDTFAYQDLIDTGQMLGPRAFSTGPGVFRETDIHSAQDAEDTLGRYKTFYRTSLLKSYDVGNRQQRQWVVEAAQKLHVMPTTEGRIDTALELTHVIDGFAGNEHNMPTMPLYKDVVALVAQSGTTYTPTLIVSYGGPTMEHAFLTTADPHDDARLTRFIPHGVLDSITTRMQWVRKNEYVYPLVAAQAAKIVRAGGRVGIGGHGELQGLQCHWEMWALAEGGLSNLEVIHAATLSGAEAIGLAQDLGSIEPGKLADLIILDKNPLDDIHNTRTVRLVMKNGELFNSEDLAEVWPVKKTQPKPWWVRENEDLQRAAGSGRAGD